MVDHTHTNLNSLQHWLIISPDQSKCIHMEPIPMTSNKHMSLWSFIQLELESKLLDASVVIAIDTLKPRTYLLGASCLPWSNSNAILTHHGFPLHPHLPLLTPHATTLSVVIIRPLKSYDSKCSPALDSSLSHLPPTLCPPSSSYISSEHIDNIISAIDNTLEACNWSKSWEMGACQRQPSSVV